MSARTHIRGPVFAIDGDVDTDTIIKSHHCTTVDRQILAPHCLAELRVALPFASAGECPLVVCRGTFGIGSARIQAPLALAGAGVRAIVARAFAPIFFENCINGALLLPLVAELPTWPETGTEMALEISSRTVAISWEDERVALPCALPDWALSGHSWMDVIEREARAAGGLEALRKIGPRLR